MQYPEQTTVLIATAITTGTVLVGVTCFLVVHRVYNTRRRRTVERERVRITAALSRWLRGEDDGTVLAQTMQEGPGSAALHQLMLAVAAHVPRERRDELAAVLRRGNWSARATRRATSPFWWRRLDAARVLSLTATEEHDIPVVARLLADPHPAVQTTAVRALLRVPQTLLITTVLDRLPTQPVTLRIIEGETLQQLWAITVPLLAERLRRRDVPAAYLEAWINFADTMGAPEALEPIIALRTHADANVRVAAARTLRSCYHPGAATALTELMGDADWRVRGQAARGLGALAVRTAIPQLRQALSDSSWWVRFRAALALAQMQEPGRQALREARAHPDRFASEMAVMVSGLSDGSITELTEA